MQIGSNSTLGDPSSAYRGGWCLTTRRIVLGLLPCQVRTSTSRWTRSTVAANIPEGLSCRPNGRPGCRYAKFGQITYGVYFLKWPRQGQNQKAKKHNLQKNKTLAQRIHPIQVHDSSRPPLPNNHDRLSLTNNHSRLTTDHQPLACAVKHAFRLCLACTPGIAAAVRRPPPARRRNRVSCQDDAGACSCPSAKPARWLSTGIGSGQRCTHTHPCGATTEDLGPQDQDGLRYLPVSFSLPSRLRYACSHRMFRSRWACLVWYGLARGTLRQPDWIICPSLIHDMHDSRCTMHDARCTLELVFLDR